LKVSVILYSYDELSSINSRIVIIEGGFFMGNAKAIKNFAINFWDLHDERLKKGFFIGKDETLMNILIFERKPHHFVRLRSQNECIHKYVDVWFYYQYFLASDYFFDCLTKRNELLIF